MGTLFFERALLPSGWASDVAIGIDGGEIASVVAGSPPRGAERIAGVAVPGMVNLHSHAFQRGMAGLAEQAASGDDSFWTWRETMYLFVERLTPADLADIARLAYCEMAEAGFTSLVEFHYLHHAPDGRPYDDVAEMSSVVAQAAAEAGLGLTLLPVLYRFGNFGRVEPQPRQRRFLNDPDRYARLLEGAGRALARTPGAVLGLAPHSLRAVAPEDIALLASLPAPGPIHIHAAEQEKEVADCLAWSKRRPVEWLVGEACIGERWCLIHATHMTEEETVNLAKSRAVAGLCPLTEANLGDGIFPAELYRANGGRLGVGSDSNVEIDAAGEMRILEYGQRLTRRRRNRLADPGQSIGRSLFDAAVEGGAQAAGRPVGRLAPGNRADIVVLDGEHPSLAARDGDALLDGWLFAAQRGAVKDVWAEGQRVVAGGRHRLKDDAVRRYNSTLRRVLG